MRNYRLKMPKKDREKCHDLLKNGSNQARVLTRCRVLLASEKGQTLDEISHFLEIARDTAHRIRTRYRQEGLEAALHERVRPGCPRKIGDQPRQRIVALACSDPPPGYAKWSLRLLAEEAVRRKMVTAIGKDRVRDILRHHRLKPWRKKNVVCAQAE